jgi:hypothetical protein
MSLYSDILRYTQVQLENLFQTRQSGQVLIPKLEMPLWDHLPLAKHHW